MPRIRLPGSAGPSSPLLPHDTEVYDRPRPPRRRRALLVALVPLATLLTLALAHHPSVPAALEPYTDHIPDLRVWRQLAAAHDDLAPPPPAPPLSDDNDRLADEHHDDDDDDDDERLPAIAWSKADRHLRRYSWPTPKIHSSLARMLQDLSPVRRPSRSRSLCSCLADSYSPDAQAQNTTRQWLLKSRTATVGGVGVGLGAEDPPRRIMPAPPLPPHSFAPAEGEGPGLFVDGSYDKCVLSSSPPALPSSSSFSS